MVDVDVRISSYVKEELVWAVEKWLQVISTIMLFKNSKGIVRICKAWYLDIVITTCFQRLSY